MGNNTADAAISQEAVPEEPQAPPYVLHRHPLLGSSADQVESLPVYTENHDPNSPINIQELSNALFIAHASQRRENDVNLWRRYMASRGTWKQIDGDNSTTQKDIINHYFSAIEHGQEDVIAFLIENHLVTANSRRFEMTPLLMAVSKKQVGVVQQLIELGANPNEFGSPVQYYYSSRGATSTSRTPLQLAASMGHLVLVKFLMEQYHCDDSLIAPDGQIALRLAAENGHREIVDYLPARRGGGFRRWKHKNQNAIRRAKRAAKGLGNFVKFFVWDIEKFFLWTVPKHLIVKPLAKVSAWCWEHRREFGPWCVRQAKELPRRVAKFVKWVGKEIARVGRDVWEEILAMPKTIKKLAVLLWNIVSVRIPKAVALLGRWVAAGFSSVAKVVWNAILKTVSFLSTVVAAIVSFFRSLTLKDIWNGFCEALSAVFVALPKLIWSWVMAFGNGTYKLMKILLGELGVVLWWIGYALLWVVTFIPRKLYVLFESFGSVIGRGAYEVRVWLDPKAR